MTCHLNIGSNQGNRQVNIDRAIALIDLRAGKVTAVSSMIESEPWGYESPNRFLNIGINIETELEPQKLLECLQGIEKEISPASHRDSDGNYIDRVIDIDIIDIKGVVMETPRLTVPHPRAMQRDFVKIPLEEIWK